MVTQLERQELIQQWRHRPRLPRTTVCKCATGLLLLIVLAQFGSPANGTDGAIAWSGAQPRALESPEAARHPG
jgi:hypothetical protein